MGENEGVLEYVTRESVHGGSAGLVQKQYNTKMRKSKKKRSYLKSSYQNQSVDEPEVKLDGPNKIQKLCT